MRHIFLFYFLLLVPFLQAEIVQKYLSDSQFARLAVSGAYDFEVLGANVAFTVPLTKSSGSDFNYDKIGIEYRIAGPGVSAQWVLGPNQPWYISSSGINYEFVFDFSSYHDLGYTYIYQIRPIRFNKSTGATDDFYGNISSLNLYFNNESATQNSYINLSLENESSERYAEFWLSDAQARTILGPVIVDEDTVRDIAAELTPDQLAYFEFPYILNGRLYGDAWTQFAVFGENHLQESSDPPYSVTISEAPLTFYVTLGVDPENLPKGLSYTGFARYEESEEFEVGVSFSDHAFEFSHWEVPATSTATVDFGDSNSLTTTVTVTDLGEEDHVTLVPVFQESDKVQIKLFFKVRMIGTDASLSQVTKSLSFFADSSLIGDVTFPSLYGNSFYEDSYEQYVIKNSTIQYSLESPFVVAGNTYEWKVNEMSVPSDPVATKANNQFTFSLVVEPIYPGGQGSLDSKEDSSIVYDDIDTDGNGIDDTRRVYDGDSVRDFDINEDTGESSQYDQFKASKEADDSESKEQQDSLDQVTETSPDLSQLEQRSVAQANKLVDKENIMKNARDQSAKMKSLVGDPDNISGGDVTSIDEISGSTYDAWLLNFNLTDDVSFAINLHPNHLKVTNKEGLVIWELILSPLWGFLRTVVIFVTSAFFVHHAWKELRSIIAEVGAYNQIHGADISVSVLGNSVKGVAGIATAVAYRLVLFTFLFSLPTLFSAFMHVSGVGIFDILTLFTTFFLNGPSIASMGLDLFCTIFPLSHILVIALNAFMLQATGYIQSSFGLILKWTLPTH